MDRDVTAAPLGAPHARVDFLDTLRFIAAAAVFYQHVSEIHGEIGSKLVSLLSPGVFGVVLFFIVSGFVIPMSTRRGFDLPEFILRRFFRIYPLVLVVFAALALLAFCTDLQHFRYARHVSARDWAANLLLIQDYTRATPLWGVTWTLSLEWIWYALFAVSMLLIGCRFDHYLSVGLPIFMLAVAAFSLLTEIRAPVGRIGMIYAAVLGCRMYRRWQGEIGTRRSSLDATVFIVTMAMCNLVGFGYFKHPNITLMQALVPWIVAPAFFVLVVSVPRLRELPLLRNAILSRLGAISFSIYLLHPFAIGLAEDIDPAQGWELALVLTLLFSIVGYNLIEVPGQAIGRKLSAWHRSRSLSRAAVASV